MVIDVDDRPSLDLHREALENLAEETLRPYLDELNARQITPESKEFNDPIWGTIRLRPLEVGLLNSPLLQRLRRIRQLGVVHLVYMAATHTRLEHSLGVVHQVQRLSDSLNTRGLVGNDGSASAPKVIEEDLVETLRLAALCHDIGHGAMSHVSEYALDSDRACSQLRLAFQKQQNLSHQSQLSEMAAYYVIGSPAFKELLKTLRERLLMTPAPEQAAKMQQLILGAQVDKRVVLAHEFISGPFDADKLDYLARDATMCGVPIISDVTRLIQKVRATHTSTEQLPAQLQSRLQAQDDGFVITGLARSGGSTLMELSLARVLMFDKVYRHHTVRAAESMVFEIVRRLASLFDGSPAMVPFLLVDEQLLDLDASAVCRLLNKPWDELPPEDQNDARTICDIAARLRERRLFVRALAFSGTMTGDEYRDDEEHRRGLQGFLQEIGHHQGRAQFVRNICARLRELADAAGEPDLLAPFEHDLEAYVHLSPPKPAPKTMGSNTDHTYLIDDDGAMTSLRDDAPETAGWSDAYVATHDLGHVFCPAELAPWVYLACETELRASHQIRMPASMLPYAKQRAADLTARKVRLAAAGYYDLLPSDLRPDPPILTRADVPRRLRAAAEKVSKYVGPVSEIRGVRSSSDSAAEARLRAYLKQFQSDGFIDMAIEMVDAVHTVGRSDISDTLEAFLSRNPQFEEAHLCSLGQLKDSSSVFTNLGLDAGTSHGMLAVDLAQALAANRPIVFLDDFIGLGNQSVDILQSWLGLPRTSPLNEARDVLAEEQQNALREAEIGFAFVAGLSDGPPHLSRFLEEQGLHGVVHVGLTEARIPTLSSVLGSHDHFDAFEGFCAQAGSQALIGHGGKDRAESWRSERALGYGGRGLLFTSMFNTPTVSLTALWAGGDAAAWQPLFPRRTKL